MKKYAIYTYQLTEKPKQCDGEIKFDEPEHVNLSPNMKFETIFGSMPGTELKIMKFNKNSVDIKPCVIIRHDMHIILLRLVNEMEKGIWEEKPTNSPITKIEKTKKPTMPYNYVIIDNRPDVQMIAIQTGSEAWKKPNVVKDLLQDSFNWIMDVNNYGLEVTIKSKMMPTRFWDYVQKKKREDKVEIKAMVFSFANHLRRPEIDIMSALSSKWRHLESFMGMVNQLGGDKGELRIEPPKNDALMKKKLADIKHMVEICMVSDYSLSVTFTDNVIYKCNEEVRAEMPMDDVIRKEFEQGFYNLFDSCSLTKWFDEIVEKTKKYKDVEEIKTKPGRNNKRQIS